ncbi:MAG TPA: hypothetical protein VKZ79_07020 [Alphaproteobacteria bacterium]|nr:hypothetical protein [Alphaproteobacteria bacterium]
METPAQREVEGMITSFDGFVGVDWSGARGARYDGIAVARCGKGQDAPMLVDPPGRKWRRSDFVEWLAGCSNERLLVGIDCAFALPEETARAFLGNAYTVFDLWKHVDLTCAEFTDYYGGAFAEHEAHRRHFWTSGTRPTGFAELHRATEHACRKGGHGAPESPLKLVGARQVGKGGLAGMRVLAELTRRLGDAFCVWPFADMADASVICVELYPRLFLRAAGHGNSKVRTRDDLDRCLAALRSSAYAGPKGKLSDHETDALVASAGLRWIADDPSIWMPPGLDPLARRAEGWILGVT